MTNLRPVAWLACGLLSAVLVPTGCTKDAAGGNRAPRAVAGADLAAAPDTTVVLDGRASSDPDGDALIFTWSVVAAPARATFDITAPAEALTGFSPHAPGTYMVRLLVADGHGGSGQDSLQIHVRGGCGSDTECDDGVGCTADSCQQGACQHTPQNASCPNDGFYCTGVESCDAVLDCVASGDPCAPRGLTCDEGLDACTGCAQDSDCDDQVDCTGDACAGGTCSNTVNPALCPDDGLFCDGAESCDALQGCVPGASPCLAPTPLCDEAGDRCVACLTAADCGDGVGCTDDACTDGACGHTPNAGQCPDDGLFCTGVESCDPLLDCVASGNPCLASSQVCDEGLGACVACQVDLDCDDQDPCTEDTCQLGGSCQREPLVCTDNVDCTDDACLNGACVFTPNALSCPDDGQFCNGAESCDPALGCVHAGNPCQPGVSCQGTCDGVLGRCADPAGTPCGDLTENGPCNLADSCDGQGSCDPHLAGAEVSCPDLNQYDCWKAGCDGQGACGQQAAPEDASYECRASLGVCDQPESCTGAGGACPADQQAPGGSPCDNGQGDVCGATCQSGTCDGDPPPDGTPCAGGGGMCCTQTCRAGWECCQDDECDDFNVCTDDACDTGTCTNTCPDPDCLTLTAVSPMPVGSSAQLELQACRADLDPAQLVCVSDRNQEGVLVDEDFEVDLGLFSVWGNTARHANAQNPNSAGAAGLAICGNDGWASLDLNTQGRHGLLLMFSLANSSLGGNEMLGADYRGCPACEWRSLVLIGDDLSQPYQDYRVFLPPDAEDAAQIRLSFYISNANNGGDCAYLDDVRLVDLLPETPIAVLLDEDFEAGLGVFTETDPDGDDVTLLDDGGTRVVQIDDHKNAAITAQVDTSAVDRRDLLVLRWKWREAPGDPLEDGEYAFLQLSTDGGGNWTQLSGIGHTFKPTSYVEYSALLPCEAYGQAALRLRFISPETSSSGNNEGIRVDEVVLESWSLAWTDAFNDFNSAGGGLYFGGVGSSTVGSASVSCSYGCGAAALESDPVTVEFE